MDNHSDSNLSQGGNAGLDHTGVRFDDRNVFFGGDDDGMRGEIRCV
jgi:hypothetical protein